MTITTYDLHTWSKTGTTPPVNGAANKIDFSNVARQFIFNSNISLNAGNYALLIDISNMSGWDAGAFVVRAVSTGATGFSWDGVSTDWAGVPTGTEDQTLILPFTTTSSGIIEFDIGPGSVSDNFQNMTIGVRLDDNPTYWNVTGLNTSSPIANGTVRYFGNGFSGVNMSAKDMLGNVLAVSNPTTTQIDVTVPLIHELPGHKEPYGGPLRIYIEDAGYTGPFDVADYTEQLHSIPDGYTITQGQRWGGVNLASGLVTETITVESGAQYIVIMSGASSDTVVLSDAATGTLTANGTNDQILLVDATTTSLTLTVTGTLTKLAVVDVTDQLNPYIPHDEIGQWNTTTNASYAHNGILHKVEGSTIAERLNFNGSAQYLTTQSNIVLADGDIISGELILDSTATGTVALFDNDTGSNQAIWRIDTSNGNITQTSGLTTTIDGTSATVYPLDGLPHVIEVAVSGSAIGKIINLFLAKFDFSDKWKGSANNIGIRGSDGVVKHFWKIDGSTNDLIGSNDLTYVGDVPSNLDELIPVIYPTIASGYNVDTLEAGPYGPLYKNASGLEAGMQAVGQTIVDTGDTLVYDLSTGEIQDGADPDDGVRLWIFDTVSDAWVGPEEIYISNVDSIPDAFTLNNITGSAPASTVNFDLVTVEGVDAGVNITPVLTGDAINKDYTVIEKRSGGIDLFPSVTSLEVDSVVVATSDTYTGPLADSGTALRWYASIDVQSLLYLLYIPPAADWSDPDAQLAFNHRGLNSNEIRFTPNGINGGNGGWLALLFDDATRIDGRVENVVSGGVVTCNGTIRLAVADVGGLLNPWVPPDDIGQSHATTNASYVSDDGLLLVGASIEGGLLHEQVGCAIADRLDFDGSSQYALLESVYTTAAGDTLVFDLHGLSLTGYVCDGDDANDRGYIYLNPLGDLQSGLGGTTYINGQAGVAYDGVSAALVEFRSVSGGKKIKYIARRYTDSGHADGSVYNFKALGSDGTLKHFWKLDGSSETGITYVGGIPDRFSSSTAKLGDQIAVTAQSPALCLDQAGYTQSNITLDLNGVTSQATIDNRANDTPVLPSIVPLTVNENGVTSDVVLDLSTSTTHDDNNQTLIYTSSNIHSDFSLATNGTITQTVDFDQLADDYYAFDVIATDDSGTPTATSNTAKIVVAVVPFNSVENDVDLTTIDRASGQWALDYAGKLQYYPDDVSAFIGWRNGGENLVSQEQDLTASPWVDHGVVSSTLQTDTPSEGALSESTLIDATNAFNGRKLSGVLEIGRVYFASAWAKGSTGSESAFLIDAVSGGTNFTVSGSWLRYGQAFAASSTDFVVGVVGAGDSISFTGVVLVDVTAQINPYIPYADIGLSHLTTNASYEHDGVLHELVGCAIADRPDFDGPNAVAIDDVYEAVVGDVIEFEILYNGPNGKYLIDGDAPSNNLYVHSNGNGDGSLIVAQGVSYSVLGGPSPSSLQYGIPAIVQLTIGPLAVGKTIKNIFQAYNAGGNTRSTGSIYNLKIIGSDGTLKHFWRGGPTDADWQDQVGSNHGTIVNGPLAVLPDTDRGLALRPEVTELLGYSRTFESWGGSNCTATDNSILAPDGTMTGSLLTLSAANGFVRHFSNSGVPDGNKYRCSVWLKAGTLDNCRLYCLVSSGGLQSTYNVITDLTDAWKRYDLLLDLTSVTGGDYVRFRIQPGQPDGDTSGTMYAWCANVTEGELLQDTIINDTSGALIQDETLLTESISPTKNGITVTVEGFWPYSSADVPNGTVFSLHGPSTNILHCEVFSGSLSMIKYVGGAIDGSTATSALTFSKDDPFKIVATMTPDCGISIDLNDGEESATNASAVIDLTEAANTINIGSDRIGANVLPLNVTSASYKRQSDTFFNKLSTNSFAVDSLFSGDILETEDYAYVHQTTGTSEVDPTDGSIENGSIGDVYEVSYFDTSAGSWLPPSTKTVGDNEPDSFSFTPATNADVDTQFTSDAITVTGIDVGVSIIPVLTGSATDKKWSKNGGAFVTSGTVTLNDTFRVQGDSSSIYSNETGYTDATVIADLNGEVGTFTIQNRANHVPVLSSQTFAIDSGLPLGSVIANLSSFVTHNDSSQTLTFTSSNISSDLALSASGVITTNIDPINGYVTNQYTFDVVVSDDANPAGISSAATMTVDVNVDPINVTSQEGAFNYSVSASDVRISDITIVSSEQGSLVFSGSVPLVTYDSNVIVDSQTGDINYTKFTSDVDVTEKVLVNSQSGMFSYAELQSEVYVSNDIAINSQVGSFNYTAQLSDVLVTENVPISSLEGSINFTELQPEVYVSNNIILTSGEGSLVFSSTVQEVGITNSSTIDSIIGEVNYRAYAADVNVSETLTIQPETANVIFTTVISDVNVTETTVIDSATGSINYSAFLSDVYITSNALVKPPQGLIQIEEFISDVFVSENKTIKAASGLLMYKTDKQIVEYTESVETPGHRTFVAESSGY